MGAAPRPKTNIVPMRTLSDKEALAWLVGRGRVETNMTKLASDWRWSSTKVKRHLDRWSAAGEIEVKPGLGGKTVITAIRTAVTGQPVQAPSSQATTDQGPLLGTASASSAPIAASERTGDPTAAAQPAEPVPAAVEAASAAPVRPAGMAAESVQPRDAMQWRSDPFVYAPQGSARPAVILSPRPASPPGTAEQVAVTRSPAAPAPAAPVAAAPVLHPHGSGVVNALAYLVAVALAGIAAFFSISGMIVLFPGAPVAIVIMGVVMEAAKLVTVAFLAHQWRLLAGLSRLVLIVLVAGLAAINATGVYSQLVAAHFGDRVSAESAVETEAAALAAKSEVQSQTVADLDRRLAQIDGAIAEMTKRGRASGALEAIASQRKQRDALVNQRRQEADKLVALKSEAAVVTARSHRIEVEAAPIMYVAQLVGGSTEQAIRLLILLMVLTCDPLAVALTAAASRPRWRR